MYFLAFWCTFALPRGASFHGRFSSLGWRKFTGQWIQKEVGKLSLTKTRTHTNFHAIQRFLHYCCIFASFSFATCLTFFAPVFQCRILPFFYSSITFCWMCSFPIPLGLENAPECRPPHQMTSASSLVWTFFCASSFESKICSKSKNTHTIFNFSIPETFPYAKNIHEKLDFPEKQKKKKSRPLMARESTAETMSSDKGKGLVRTDRVGTSPRGSNLAGFPFGRKTPVKQQQQQQRARARTLVCTWAQSGFGLEKSLPPV